MGAEGGAARRSFRMCFRTAAQFWHSLPLSECNRKFAMELAPASSQAGAAEGLRWSRYRSQKLPLRHFIQDRRYTLGLSFLSFPMRRHQPGALRPAPSFLRFNSS
jgi:hypothetical protein